MYTIIYIIQHILVLNWCSCHPARVGRLISWLSVHVMSADVFSLPLVPRTLTHHCIPAGCVPHSPRSPRSRCCRGWDLSPPWSWADPWGWWRLTTQGSKCLDGSLWWTNITCGGGGGYLSSLKAVKSSKKNKKNKTIRRKRQIRKRIAAIQEKQNKTNLGYRIITR